MSRRGGNRCIYFVVWLGVVDGVVMVAHVIIIEEGGGVNRRDGGD